MAHYACAYAALAHLFNTKCQTCENKSRISARVKVGAGVTSRLQGSLPAHISASKDHPIGLIPLC